MQTMPGEQRQVIYAQTLAGWLKLKNNMHTPSKRTEKKNVISN